MLRLCVGEDLLLCFIVASSQISLSKDSLLFEVFDEHRLVSICRD